MAKLAAMLNQRVPRVLGQGGGRLGHYIAAAAVLLMLGWALIVAPASAQGETAAVLYIEPANPVIAVGEEITLRVMLRDAIELREVSLVMKYDPALLELVDEDPAAAGIQVIIESSFVAPQTVSMNFGDHATGMLSIAYESDPAVVAASGSGHLLTLRMRGLSSGAANVGWGAGTLLRHPDGRTMTTAYTSAQITVGEGAAPTATPTIPPPPTPTDLPMEPPTPEPTPTPLIIEVTATPLPTIEIVPTAVVITLDTATPDVGVALLTPPATAEGTPTPPVLELPPPGSPLVISPLDTPTATRTATATATITATPTKVRTDGAAVMPEPSRFASLQFITLVVGGIILVFGAIVLLTRGRGGKL